MYLFSFRHVKRSGHIGDFVISAEEAIAKGIRRIVAITGPEASKVIMRTQFCSNHSFSRDIYNSLVFVTTADNMRILLDRCNRLFINFSFAGIKES